MAEGATGTSGSQDQSSAARRREMINGQELLQRQPDTDRILGGTQQSAIALGDGGDLTERLGQVIDLVEKITSRPQDADLMSGDQRTDVLWIPLDGIDQPAVLIGRGIQGQVMA